MALLFGVLMALFSVALGGALTEFHCRRHGVVARPAVEMRGSGRVVAEIAYRWRWVMPVTIVCIAVTLASLFSTPNDSPETEPTTVLNAFDQRFGVASNAFEVFHIRYPDTSFTDFGVAATMLCREVASRSGGFDATREWLDSSGETPVGLLDTLDQWHFALAQLEIHHVC